jgi:SAM-dependent methyltransferase
MRKIFARLRPVNSKREAYLCFRCNVCGRRTKADVRTLGREEPSCPACGSTVRARALVRLLSLELFGDSLAIHEFPTRRKVRIIDMSGWEGYGRRLAEKFEYLNTYFHQEPRLDITAIDTSWEERFDIVITSDVFEHIVPPVSVAFGNAFRLLNPGGLLILTVPYSKPGGTIEHFPELYQYEVIAEKGGYRLHNLTREGVEQWYDKLVFHGGPGSTLEMRIFSEAGLRIELERAGFGDIRFHDEPGFESGVIWHENWSLPVTARKAK